MLEQVSKLVTDIFLIEDGHAQERSEFDSVLKKVKPQDLWCGDRTFCTLKFLFTLQEKKAFFAIRQHGGLGFKELEELKLLGRTETGELLEQKVQLNYEGKVLILRRVILKLFKQTRDKEWEIAIYTNLPDDVPAAKIAEIYRNRWSLESLFQTVTKNFNGEIQTLAYPKAALSYKLGRDGNRHRPVCAILIFNGTGCLQRLEYIVWWTQRNIVDTRTNMFVHFLSKTNTKI